MVWEIVAGVVVAVVAVWLLLILLLVAARPRGLELRDTARLLPDTLRLLRRLAADRSIPAGARIRLWLLFAYLASPLDLIPDFIPVIGYADDVVVVAVVLRSVVRRAGVDAVRDRWPGTADGFSALCRAVGLRPPQGA